MFEQKQHVADASGFAEFDQFLLDAQSGSVVDTAELKDGDHLESIIGIRADVARTLLSACLQRIHRPRGQECPRYARGRIAP